AVKPQHCKDAGCETLKVKVAKPVDRDTTKSGATKFGPLFVLLIPMLVFRACRLHDIFRSFGLVGKPLTESGMWRSCRRGFEEGLL
ncbi:hypothetical protein ZWY2020_028077, partial [Hordeum vulgare]